ncbi:MAG: Oligosaccharide translocation protein rft1, partial [Pleopsidium flavum]
GATFLILFQVGSRALTFLVNQVLLRYLSPELLGISTQLELYSISVLYFARESLRVALQRQHQDKNAATVRDGRYGATKAPSGFLAAVTSAGQSQAVVNLSYVVIVLGVPLAYGLATLYLRNADPSVLRAPYFQSSLNLYGFAAFFELLTEPCFVTVQVKALYRIRGSAETCATIARCALTCATAIWATKVGKDLGVLPFAVGQTGYACVLGLVYLTKVLPLAAQDGFSLALKPLYSRERSLFIMSYFPRPMLALSANLYVQSGLKHILTQGDSLLIATVASLQDQGSYALASNYGGLVARMLFQPIEESSRNVFGKLLSPDASGKPDFKGVRAAKGYLCDILRLYGLLSILVAALGPTIAPLLLRLVAGSRWSSTSAGDVLATYCYLIPLLSLNGITEAFISSVATNAELQRQSIWMFAFSVGFASAGYIFLRVLEWGAVGLVWTNVVNMLFRIIWSWAFIKDFFRRNGDSLQVSNNLPTAGTRLVGFAAAAILVGVRKTFNGGFADLVKSGGVAGGCLLLL